MHKRLLKILSPNSRELQGQPSLRWATKAVGSPRRWLEGDGVRSHTPLGIIFFRSRFGCATHICAYICIHARAHTHTLCTHLQPIKTRVIWVCLAHSWDLCVMSSREHPLGNHHCLLAATTNCHPQAPRGGTPQQNWLRGALGECHLGPGRTEKEKQQARWAGSWRRSERPRGNR